MSLLIRGLIVLFVIISLGITIYNLVSMVAIGTILSKTDMFFAGSTFLTLLSILARRMQPDEKDKQE